MRMQITPVGGTFGIPVWHTSCIAQVHLRVPRCIYTHTWVCTIIHAYT